MKKSNEILAFSIIATGSIYLLLSELFSNRRDKSAGSTLKKSKAVNSVGSVGFAAGDLLYSKVDKVRVRNSPEVNDGFISNAIATISVSGTPVGSVWNDRPVVGKDGKRWYLIKLNEPLSGNGYVREDVVYKK